MYLSNDPGLFSRAMQYYKPLFCPSVGLSIMFVNFCIFGVAAQIERDRETDSEIETGTATSVHWSVCFVTYLRESTCTRGPYLPLFLCAFVGCEFARQSTMREGLSVSVSVLSTLPALDFRGCGQDF